MNNVYQDLSPRLLKTILGFTGLELLTIGIVFLGQIAKDKGIDLPSDPTTIRDYALIFAGIIPLIGIGIGSYCERKSKNQYSQISPPQIP